MACSGRWLEHTEPIAGKEGSHTVVGAGIAGTGGKRARPTWVVFLAVAQIALILAAVGALELEQQAHCTVHQFQQTY